MIYRYWRGPVVGMTVSLILTTTTEMRELRNEPHWYLVGHDRAYVVLKAHAANPKYWLRD